MMAIPLWTLVTFWAIQEDYFPTRQGISWIYDYDGADYTVKVEGEKELDGHPCTVLQVQTGEDIRREYYSVTTEGVFLRGQTLPGDEEVLPIDPPQCILKFGAKKGERWENSEGESVTVYENHGEEVVEVPAGKFTTLKIVHKSQTPAGESVTTVWFAKKIGLVKMTSTLAGEAGSVQVLKQAPK